MNSLVANCSGDHAIFVQPFELALTVYHISASPRLFNQKAHIEKCCFILPLLNLSSGRLSFQHQRKGTLYLEECDLR